MNWFVIKNKKNGRFLLNSSAIGEIPENLVPNFMRDIIFCEDEVDSYFVHLNQTIMNFSREKYEIIPCNLIFNKE